MPMVGVKMHQCNNCIFLTEIRAPALSFGVPIARASIAALPGPRLPFCLTQGTPSGPNDFIDLHLEQMQSRKGYISSIFLQIDLSISYQNVCSSGCKVKLVTFVWYFATGSFLNVFSNCLPEQMHSHIGCICKIFHQSVFSNVSSNRLLEQMHSRIGCICMTFLQSGFSNVVSSGLNG